MSTSTETDMAPQCPNCHEPIRPGTAFCANCGMSVSEITNVPPVPATSDAGATATFTPIGTNLPDQAQETRAERSPWAAPDSGNYVQPATFASPSSYDPDGGYPTPAVPARDHEGSIRGLVLGAIAILLIAAVLALYVYDAWLSDSARATVEGWLPWLD